MKRLKLHAQSHKASKQLNRNCNTGITYSRTHALNLCNCCLYVICCSCLVVRLNGTQHNLGSDGNKNHSHFLRTHCEPTVSQA